MTSADLVLMTLADARLPTGGHTQSASLEAAVRAGLGNEGRRPCDVLDYARDRLRTVVGVEAGTAVVARHLALAGVDPRGVEPQWAARTPSAALRAASGRQGRGYLRLAGRVWPAVRSHLPDDAEVPRPVVLGTVAAVTGLTPAQAARLVAYDDAQTVLAAALKLLPLDPAQTTAWLVALHPDIEEAVAGVADVVDPATIPATSAPMIDVLAEDHAHQEMRMFHA